MAFSACANLVNTVLEKKGVPQRYTAEQLLIEFMGRNFRAMMTSLQAKFGFELTQTEIDGYVKAEEDAVILKLEAKAEPCEGSIPVLEKLSRENKYSMMVVSSSALRRIQASLRKCGQEKFFGNRVYSAVTSLPTPATKPDPAVYLFAMARFDLQPEECIAVEDSRSGATAAVQAGIPTIAYVGCYHGDKKRAEIAKTLLDVGCKAVMRHWSEFENCVAKIEAM